MQPPLFILAPPRSFTSIICAMIGNHPEMFGLAEVNLFWAETVGERRTRLPKSFAKKERGAAREVDMLKMLLTLHAVRRRLDSGLLRSLAEIAFLEQSEETIDASRRWLADNDEMTTAELFRTMGVWVAGRTLVDKSPLHATNGDALQRIGEEFPQAYFLHLTRHPTDMLRSFEKMREDMPETLKPGNLTAVRQNGVDGITASDADDLWLNTHVRILEFLEGVPAERQMRQRGEDLLSDPLKHLTEVADWLGKRTDAEAIEAMTHPENSPFAKLGPPSAPFGGDSNFMQSPALRPYAFNLHKLEMVSADGIVSEFSEGLVAQAQAFGY